MGPLATLAESRDNATAALNFADFAEIFELASLASDRPGKRALRRAVGRAVAPLGRRLVGRPGPSSRRSAAGQSAARARGRVNGN